MTRRALGAYTGLLLLALYAPLGVMALYSFNTSRYPRWEGFTLDWYRRLAGNHAVLDALGRTVVLALIATALSTALGTIAALAARRAFRGRRLYALLVTAPVLMPDIVLAYAALALFRALDVGLSIGTAACAHTTFNFAYVAIVVSARLEGLDPSLELAARDLGATPAQAFWKVTFPALAPAILSGALLAFTLSFDDFVLTYFTAGPGGSTLPVYVYSAIRHGVSPELNAVSTLLLAVTLGLLLVAARFSKIPVPGGAR